VNSDGGGSPAGVAGRLARAVPLLLLDAALVGALAVGRPSGWWLSGPAGTGPWAGALLAPVFLFVVAAEIAVMLATDGRTLPSRLRWLVASQALLVALTPTLYADGGPTLAVTVAGSGLVVAMFVLSFHFLYRNKQVSEATLALLVAWPVAALVTALG